MFYSTNFYKRCKISKNIILLKEEDIMDNKKSFFRFLKFFSRWTLIGIILILTSIILSIKFIECQIIIVIAKLIETIGIALMIGAVFDFSKNSSEFTTFISELLSNIIVSKSFLNKLCEDDKRNALSLVLQPSDKQIEQYSNINKYFNKQIDSSMKIFNTNFKSHTVLNITVFKDGDKVCSKGTLTYRIYKIQDKFEPIEVTFERSNSEVEKKRILYPGGSKTIEITDEHTKEENVAGVNYKRYIYQIPEEYNQFPYLTIESTIFEPGYDHWTNFHWTSLTPYDGLSFQLNCKDNLIIHEHVVFDEKTPYDVEYSEDKKTIKILSTEWLNAYTGFSITIGENK